MSVPTLPQLEKDVRAGGYDLLSSEQLRANRWLLVARDPARQRIAILVQLRALIGQSDVQDLAEFVRVRDYDAGILLVYNAVVSAPAQRTLGELSFGRLRVCSSLPPAHNAESTVMARLASQFS